MFLLFSFFFHIWNTSKLQSFCTKKKLVTLFKSMLTMGITIFVRNTLYKNKIINKSYSYRNINFFAIKSRANPNSDQIQTIGFNVQCQLLGRKSRDSRRAKPGYKLTRLITQESEKFILYRQFFGRSDDEKVKQTLTDIGVSTSHIHDKISTDFWLIQTQTRTITACICDSFNLLL